jgi:hypothetical protein
VSYHGEFGFEPDKRAGFRARWTRIRIGNEEEEVIEEKKP